MTRYSDISTEPRRTEQRLDRRAFLAASAAGALAVAGCVGAADDGDDSTTGDDGTSNGDDLGAVPAFEFLENPPNAVYVPTHRETMRMLDPMVDGDFALAPMLSYPHPFWIVAGSGRDSVERVEPDGTRGVHMMFTVWDRETGVVLPVDEGATVRIEQDGEPVGSPRSLWTMISQEMGFHFGDNVSLPEDGTYTVQIELPPLQTRLTGALAGRLSETKQFVFEFTYDRAFRDEVVDVEFLDEELWGERGALEPMDHGTHHGHGDDQMDDSHDGAHGGNLDVPYSQLPEIDAYPGPLLTPPGFGRPDETQTLPRTGDAAMLATVFEADHRLAESGAEYLLVSPRTPYNRVPLADMAISIELVRDGETVVDESLEQTIDSEYGLHYGISVPATQAGDVVTVEIDSPPQVSRHQGYETAFLEMEPLELQVSAE